MAVTAALSAGVVAAVITWVGVGDLDQSTLAVVITAMATLIVVAVLAHRRPSLPPGVLVGVGVMCGIVAVTSHRFVDGIEVSVAAPTLTWAAVVLLLADDVGRRPARHSGRGRVADVAATVALGAEIIGAFAFLVERSSSTALTILQAGPMACLIYVFGVRVVGTDSVRHLLLTGAFAGVVASVVSATSGHVAGMIASVCLAWIAAGALWASARIGSSVTLLVAAVAAMVTAIAARDGYVLIVLVPACLLGLSMLSDEVVTTDREQVVSRSVDSSRVTATSGQRSEVVDDRAVLVDVTELARVGSDADLAAEHWLDELLASGAHDAGDDVDDHVDEVDDVGGEIHDGGVDADDRIDDAEGELDDADDERADDDDDDGDATGELPDADVADRSSPDASGGELDWIDEAIAGPRGAAAPVVSTTGEPFEFDLWQRLVDRIDTTSPDVSTTELTDPISRSFRNWRDS